MFGIDLGTTFSAVAELRDGVPTLVPNRHGDGLTPSVVAFEKDGRVLTGREARERAVVDPGSAAAVFKRHMGTEWTRRLGGRDRTATELSALLLAALRRDAEKTLGRDIDEAVITVPAYFNDRQRNATIEAGQAAGLIVQRVINEPTAAAIAYGLHENRQSEADSEVVATDRTAAIVDLGGGTFDVSIIDQYEGVVEVKASAGEIFLGGEDFTTAMVGKLLEGRSRTLEATELKHPELVARLRHQCERAKRQLSTETEVSFPWPALDGSRGEDGDVATITREDFQTWCRPILTRIARPLRRAIGDSGLQPSEIDQVILVGGATRMPMLIDYVGELFGRPPLCTLDPDAVVALGAAVQAGLIARDEGLGELIVTDVCPFTLGIETSRELGNTRRGGYFAPIIPRNTPLPTSLRERFSTIEPGQTQLSVKIFQGEGRKVEDNLPLGEFLVTGIPPNPDDGSVDVRFTYDLNGVLEAEATVVKTGKKQQLVISSLAKTPLSKSELKKAIEKMEALKVDWRDEPENRLLLAQSERLFAELDHVARANLDGLLTVFEHALEQRDRAGVEEIRATLEQFISLHDGELNWEDRDESSDDPFGTA